MGFQAQRNKPPVPTILHPSDASVRSQASHSGKTADVECALKSQNTTAIPPLRTSICCIEQSVKSEKTEHLPVPCPIIATRAVLRRPTGQNSLK